jgi:hypothetical protein
MIIIIIIINGNGIIYDHNTQWNLPKNRTYIKQHYSIPTNSYRSILTPWHKNLKTYTECLIITCDNCRTVYRYLNVKKKKWIWISTLMALVNKLLLFRFPLPWSHLEYYVSLMGCVYEENKGAIWPNSPASDDSRHGLYFTCKLLFSSTDCTDKVFKYSHWKESRELKAYQHAG